MNQLKKMALNVAGSLFIVAFIVAPIASSFGIETAYAAEQSNSQSQPYVTLSSFSGQPGVALTVSGGGFLANDALTIAGGTSADNSVSTSISADSFGNFSTTLTIPANLAQGPYPIKVTSASRNQASNSYYVNPFAPTIQSSGAHTPYSTVLVSGVGFSRGEKVTLELAGQTAQATADSAGAFSKVSLTVPAVRSDLYLLNATGNASGAKALEYFYIEGLYPSISPSAYYVLPGATLAFSGSGYAAGETISITAGTNATVLSTFKANSSGSFTNAGGFSVPFSLGGSTATFNLVGQTSGAKSSVNVTVGSFYGYASPSSYYLTPGSILSFTGGGFGANELLNVYMGTGSNVVSTITTDKDGLFSTAGGTNIPYSAAGQSLIYKIVGSNSHATAEASLSVGQFYPTISPSNYYVAPNGSLSITGSGFAPSETITISLDGVIAGQASTTAFGTFSSSSVHLPYTGNGSATLSAIGSLSHTATAVQVTVGQFYPVVSPSTYYAFPGDTIGFTGSGFAANEAITIKKGTGASATVVANSTTDSLGMLTFSGYKVPVNAADSLTLSFTGNVSKTIVVSSIGLGARYVSLDSSTYYTQPGSIVVLSGTGFIGGEVVDIQTSEGTTKATSNSSGNFHASTTLPFTSASSATIKVTGESSGATASISIGLAPFSGSVTPNTWYTTAGSQIMFVGSGFAPSETITILLNKADTHVIATTDASGSFSKTYTIPFDATNGNFEFTSSKTHADILVPITLATPYVSLSFNNYYGVGGSPFTINGSGFVPGETVNFKTSYGTFASTVADTNGSFAYSTHVPFGPAGSITISAKGVTSGRTSSSDFTLAEVYTSINLQNYAGAPGQAVTFIGSNYLSNEPVEIYTDRNGSSAVATFNADSNGNFTNSNYVVPADATEGKLTFTIKGTQSFSTKSIVYYVTGK